ncbi:type I restriction enzyme HsdR N-terminal domain-containing protein [Marivirga atlantica]|jgi:hypothetical protein|uniref:Type I restriction enzyme HsdR N-terminal domain-containing protein n=1 Tax=Marivirga atlantica TaxID=1548457 RepID=A0A937AMF6_9BACT|nr:type I restriction enzyme HsdR N-terminal domain-containing protein [Marivirga atlantica]MBL0765372.1 type I restriction enzyme HsdR N-terminal domain-containing protein [Marivirga atlantica]
MVQLNLPPYEVKLQKMDGKIHIFDSIRKKYLVLTSEEWVRQHFLHFLIKHKSYPQGLISMESGIKYNQLQKRTDMVVRNRDLSPLLLVECKAPEVKLNDQVFRQITTYFKEFKAKYMIVTNGLEHYCFSIENGAISFKDEIPTYDAIA